jgi:hypothetical protein
VIVRDASGEPTGILLESAANLVSRHIPKPTQAELAQAVHRACEDLARRGILAASDAATGWHDLEAEAAAYAQALEEGAPVRMTLMPLYGAAQRAGWLEQPEQAGEATGFRPQPPSPHPDLRWGAVKLFADGAFTTRTAALRQPYADTPTTGVLMYEPDDLMARILTVHRAGWQCAVHAIGDRAIELMLQGYRRALEAYPRPHHRHRIEHAMLMADDLLVEMQALGVVVVPQPEFLWWLTGAYLKGLGERAVSLMPFRSWLQAGVALGFSSDQPVVPGEPILGWRAAVTRTSRDGTCLSPDEALRPANRAADVHRRRGVCRLRRRHRQPRARQAGALHRAVPPAQTHRRRRHAGRRDELGVVAGVILLIVRPEFINCPLSLRFPPLREGNRARVRFTLLAGGTCRRGVINCTFFCAKSGRAIDIGSVSFFSITRRQRRMADLFAVCSAWAAACPRERDSWTSSQSPPTCAAKRSKARRRARSNRHPKDRPTSLSRPS